MRLYDVVRYVFAHACEVYEERGNHMVYGKPETGATTLMRRHRTVGPAKVERNGWELGIPLPPHHDAPTHPENWGGLMVEIPLPCRWPWGSSRER